MVIVQGMSKRKKTGGKYHKWRSKRLYELGREFIEIKIGPRKIKRIFARGNTIKLRALKLDEANVLDPKTNKFKKAKIISVKENKANPYFVRRNVITRGAVIETSIGLAKVLNRPGQEGTINAILIESS